jgi:tungstate transport system ATP-binding protein
MPPLPAQGPSVGQGPFVAFESVSVRHGDVQVLRDVSLRLALTQRTVVLGPNGAGKTTLLQLMHGLAEPSHGRVSRGWEAGVGTDLRLAYLFQKPVMLRRSARANLEHALALVGVPARQRRDRAMAALSRIGLGYAAERPARRLSGGEQQRVALARAQALDPHCLLLDEPTASLDPGAAALIERELLGLADLGVGLVMATHDLALARRLATRVVFMHRGQVLESGPAPACFESPRHETFRRFLSGQWLD